MEIINLNNNIHVSLANKLLSTYKNTIELFNDPNDIDNIEVDFDDKINYSIILISLISFSIIIYLLYFYNHNIYIFIIFSSIISILSDGNIITGKYSKLLHKLDMITASISLLGVGAILSERVNILIIILTIYISTRVLKFSRKAKDLEEWTLRHNIWHLTLLIILLTYLQIFNKI